MYIMVRFSALAAVVLTAGLIALGCGGGDDGALPSGAAAQIGDTVVTQKEVLGFINSLFPHGGGYKEAFGPPDYPRCVEVHSQYQNDPRREGKTPAAIRRSILKQCRFEYAVIKAQTVAFLVNAEWLRREARRTDLDTKGFVAASARITKSQGRLAAATGTNADRLLEASAMTSKGALFRARADYLQNRLLAATPVADATIRRYAKHNFDVFLDSERRRVSIVQTLTEAQARRARRALTHGSTWHAVQKRYGYQPAADHWSGTKTIRESATPHDAFGRGVFKAKLAKTVGPVRTLNGWFVYQVRKIIPAKSGGLSSQARHNILVTIRAKRLSTGLHRRYAAMTQCAKEYEIPEAPQCM